VEDFTPVSGLIGGLLIGLSTALMMLLNGRVGLLLGALVYVLATGGTLPVNIQASLPVMVIAGLLVGFGTRLGSGCTSGHGVSGIARFSKRSIVATLVFTGTAIATVYVTGHVL
jgi:uncharacterized protein